MNQRARIAFFVDTYISKIVPPFFAIARAPSAEAAEEAVPNLISALTKEIEPLLTDAAPFFGGSSRLTLAEVFLSAQHRLYGRLTDDTGTNRLFHPPPPKFQ